jgi:hypothetical protein
VKGPFERLKYDPRRLWECPVCNHRERAPGTVTTRLCPCQAKEEPLKHRYMRLLEEGYRRVETTMRPPQVPTESTPTESSVLPTADPTSTAPPIV